MDVAPVVTCFLRNRGEVLLLKRADDAETYPGRWGAVTGYVEDDDPAGSALMEIREETGIEHVELVRAGDGLTVRDDSLAREWRVSPFLFDVDARDVTTNEETVTAEWTSPTTMLRRETVPDLWRSYEQVAPSPETVAQDTEHGSAYISVCALESLRDAAGRAAVRGDAQGAVTARAVELLESRPSMAALVNRVNRVMAEADSPASVESAAIREIERALDADDGAANVAQELVGGGIVLTHSRSGTVRAACRRGADAVIVAESRPAREGVWLAESLADSGRDVTLCTDAAVAHVLATREVDLVLVGADAVLPDGRVVNKTGTRTIALAANHERVPCYVVAAADKIRGDDEEHLETGPPSAVYDGDAPLETVNPTFDVTPADLVSGVATERGLLSPDEVADIASEQRRLAQWRDG